MSPQKKYKTFHPYPGWPLYSGRVRLRRLALAAAVVGLGALVLAAGAQACSCAPSGPVEALHRSDAAIVGQLVEVAPRSRSRADYRYRVQRVYRGAKTIERGETISVRSSRGSAACGLPRRQDRPVGLFLLLDGGRWTAGVCSMISPQRLWEAAKRGRGGTGAGTSCAS
jgi:hypothetical protein